MSKVKTVYRCEQCGTDHPKWAGQCIDCGEWNSLTEVRIEPTVTHRAQPKIGGGYAGQAAKITTLNKVSVSHETRLMTGIGEFDRVLGEDWSQGLLFLLEVTLALVNPQSFYKPQRTWHQHKVPHFMSQAKNHFLKWLYARTVLIYRLIILKLWPKPVWNVFVKF